MLSEKNVRIVNWGKKKFVILKYTSWQKSLHNRSTWLFGFRVVGRICAVWANGESTNPVHVFSEKRKVLVLLKPRSPHRNRKYLSAAAPGGVPLSRTVFHITLHSVSHWTKVPEKTIRIVKLEEFSHTVAELKPTLIYNIAWAKKQINAAYHPLIKITLRSYCKFTIMINIFENYLSFAEKCDMLGKIE